jgi:hypothetical protein
MNGKNYLFGISLVLLLSCQPDTKRHNTTQEKAAKSLPCGLDQFKAIQKQIQDGNDQEVVHFMTQIEKKTGKKSPTTNTPLLEAELIKQDLIDLLKVLPVNDLVEKESFEKKAILNAAPEGYQLHGERCPDRIALSVDTSTCGFTIHLLNTFYVDEEIGCGETSTSYFFIVNEGHLVLKDIQSAG